VQQMKDADERRKQRYCLMLGVDIEVGERGVWRGLVLADRSARWCVFAEWTCV